MVLIVVDQCARGVGGEGGCSRYQCTVPLGYTLVAASSAWQCTLVSLEYREHPFLRSVCVQRQCWVSFRWVLAAGPDAGWRGNQNWGCASYSRLAILLGVNESSRAELSQPLSTCKLPWLRAGAPLVPPSKASPSQAAARAGAVFFRARLRGVVIISAATLWAEGSTGAEACCTESRPASDVKGVELPALTAHAAAAPARCT